MSNEPEGKPLPPGYWDTPEGKEREYWAYTFGCDIPNCPSCAAFRRYLGLPPLTGTTPENTDSHVEGT